MSKYSDIIWPRLDRGSEADRHKLKKSNEKAIGQIERANWKPIDSILEEARRLALSEEERRKSADTKAAIYLAILAAVIPLSATLIKDLPTSFRTFEYWQLVIQIGLFVWTMCYLLAAGIWAFRTIQVSVQHRVDVDELVKLSNQKQVDVALCKEILKSVRNNRDTVNEKISRMIMAHRFLKHMFVSFILFLIWTGFMGVIPLFCLSAA